MKKHIFLSFVTFWACSFYSCSELELIDPFSIDTTTFTDSTLRFDPAYKEVNISSEFDMDIYVDQVANLIGIEIEFTYNPTFVSFDTAKVNSSIPSSSYNILIQDSTYTEAGTEAGTVLLTLTTPQDNGEGLTEQSNGLVQVSFTSLKSGFFELGLTEQSKFIQHSSPTVKNSFLASSLKNATIIIE